MMARPILFPLLFFFLIGLSLACNLPNAIASPGPMQVNPVDVAPAAGTGRFTASVGIPPTPNQAS